MSDLAVVFGVIKNLVALNLAEISRAEWELFQGYGYFVLVLFLVGMLYGYYFHLYRAEKRGSRNYEKYASLALQDELNDAILEKKEPK